MEKACSWQGHLPPVECVRDEFVGLQPGSLSSVIAVTTQELTGMDIGERERAGKWECVEGPQGRWTGR